MHRPVLLQQTIELLDVQKGMKYIDATAGEGGHLEGLLKKEALVLAIDRDSSQIDALRMKFKNQANLVLDIGNFAHIDKIAEKNNFFPVQGIIFDLGLSMKQLSEGGKGLSFKHDDEYLDMRLDESCETDARTIVNTYDASRLYEVFAKNAEENNSQTISSSIVRARIIKKIEKVGDLKKAIESALGKYDQRTVTRIFQALRIEVNNEFENIRSGLQGAAKILAPGGLIAVITFHSVEDRIVKQSITKYGFSQITKKVVVADSDASYERSAKLRVFKKNEALS